ncbi:MAG TPA: hypothetical protein VL992_19245 [Tepidisphaeraceae bacterium]|nr:hypothetical protein [Tepidisphaeraceae bacterium]
MFPTLTCLLFATLSLLLAAAPGFGDSLSRAAIEARLDALQNMQADYQYRIDHDEDPALPTPPSARRIDRQRTELGRASFSFLSGLARMDTITDPATLAYYKDRFGMNVVARELLIVGRDGRVDSINQQATGPNGKLQSNGGISNFRRFREEWTLDLALGLRLYRDSRWLTAHAIESAREISSADPNIVALRITNLGEPNTIHDLQFDKRLLDALVYYRCTFGPGTDSYEEITNSNFVRQGNVFLPMHIVRRGRYIDTSGNPRHPLTYTLTIKSYHLGDASNNLAAYQMAWPANHKIYDSRVKQVIDVGPTTRPLTDDDIRAQLAQNEQTRQDLLDTAQQRINEVLGTQP